MTVRRPKPCTVCGVRVDSGKSRCPAHEARGSGRRPRGCLVCGRLGQGDYCALHEPSVDEAARNARNPYRQAYKDQEYARNRQHRYERARGRCEDCGRPVGPGEWECDHVVPLSQGGSHAIEFLRIRCVVPRPGAPRGCHGLKTAADRRSRRRA